MAYNHTEYKAKLAKLKTLLEDVQYDISRMEFECGPDGMTERQQWAVYSIEKTIPDFQREFEEVKGIINETLYNK